MRLVSLSVLALFLVALPAPAEPPSVGSAPPRAGRFEATWKVEGSREALEFEGLRDLAIFSHHGRVTVVRSDGFVNSALSKCIGLSDSATGSTSRCVWLEGKGDQIFSEVERAPGPDGTAGRGQGRFIGGTGRFEGIQGRFELSFVMEPPLGSRIRGETVSMIGSWQLPEAHSSR